MQACTFLLMLFYCPLAAASPKLFPVQDGERCGYSDASGKTAIAPQFSDCASFSEGMAAVQIDGRWGYIDESGAAVIPPTFLAAEAFSEGLAFVTVSAESKAVIDRQGKILFNADYYGHGKFSEGLAAVQVVSRWVCTIDDKIEVRETCPDGKGIPRDSSWGYINVTGAFAISPRFFSAHEFHDGLAHVDVGFTDRQGNKVINGPFTNATSFASGLAAVQVDSKNWGYIDKRGGWLALPTFDQAGPLEEGRGLVKVNGKYGYVDTSGSLVIAAKFDSALAFSEGRAAVREGAKWGYIDNSGNVVIPIQFETAQSFENGYATVAIESRTAVIDKRGAVVKTQPATLAQTFQRLQGFEVDSSGFSAALDEILPILTLYKQQLRQLAIESLKDSDNAAAAKAAIETKLRNAGIRSPNDQDEERRPFGLVNLEIVQPALQTDLLSVLFHLHLAHGTDTSLSIFRHGSANWDLVFKLDRNERDTDFYHMAPPQFTASDANGSFLMLLASDSERYGDGGYRLLVDLYRIDGAFNTKDQLSHQTFDGKDHQIALDANGFRLETISMEHDAARAGYRVFPYRYELHSDQLIRVAPIGFDAYDFVGEWGNLPWDEAAKWSDPANITRIREYYNKLRTTEGYFGGEFGAVQTCDPQQKTWQVEYEGRDNASLYFQVERKDKWTFIVKDISEKKQDGCKDVEWRSGQPFLTMFSKPLEW